jgi:ABC-type nitrate/sulfonate/bicarbonate transport system ATPase subunit
VSGVAGRAKLHLEAVSHAFDGRPVLGETTLDIDAGEFVAVVGPSGCGKSTLFNIVAGLIQPTHGRVLIDGADITGTTGRMGYMLQKDLLLPWRTVLDNVLLGRSLRHRTTGADREEALDLLARYGLGSFSDHYPHALSGGMRQRAALIRTIVFSREVLLLDEPFGALDSQTRLLMQEWLLQVYSEIDSTILFITHDVDEALFLADRVLVMSARPGTIKGVFAVPFERPRTYEQVTSDAFVALKREVFGLIYEESVRAAHDLDPAAAR